MTHIIQQIDRKLAPTPLRENSRAAANEQFCKSWGKVQNSTVVLLLSSSAKLNFSASISQPSQSYQNEDFKNLLFKNSNYACLLLRAISFRWQTSAN